ncbi:hypothetical protein PEBR_42299 [Penicillium brasilianum]|uniref:Uncharacterized protein n=1 Tax=Penicillium brasilianum TaxID=104259 RepID=A0A1S9R8B1_PENBI|nr:hypothetical protein PEBR_42299 [Penicillium brasilianum]
MRPTTPRLSLLAHSCVRHRPSVSVLGRGQDAPRKAAASRAEQGNTSTGPDNTRNVCGRALACMMCQFAAFAGKYLLHRRTTPPNVKPPPARYLWAEIGHEARRAG